MSVHLIGLLLLGCTSDDSPEVVLDPGIELGTGVDEFVPLEDGDEMAVILGPQGGYHLDGSLRVQGIDPGNEDDLGDPRNPLTVFEAVVDDGTVVSGLAGATSVEYRQGIKASETPGVYEMVGRRILLDIQDDSELQGRTLTVSVTVEDVDGVVLTDERDVVAVAGRYND